MPTPIQKQNLIDAVSQIRSAEQVLLDVSRSMSDPAKLIQINMEYSHLDSYLSQILHTQAITDDASFNDAVVSLKGQISALSMDADSIKKIVDDVAAVGKIVGFIAKAIDIVGKL